MKLPLLWCSLLCVATAAEMPSRTKDGAVLVVEPVPAAVAEAAAKSPPETRLRTFGEKTEGSIRIIMVGSVVKPGIYHVPAGISLADAIATAGGFDRLASSRFSIRRGASYYRLWVGASHGVAPIAKEVLPLFLLRDGDEVYTQEVNPF